MSEPRWDIPALWSWAAAAEIADIVGGGTPSTRDETNFSRDGIPWITPADLTNYRQTYIKRGARNLSEKGYQSSGAQLMPAGTVLFSSRAPVGYCVISANEISTNQGFKSLVPKGGISPEYVRHYLLASKEYAESLASGTTFKELSGSRTAELSVPVAPLAEQRRIVAELDMLTGATARARAELDRIPALIARYKQAILSAAFTGELTREWRDGAYASDDPATILNRLQTERDARRKSEGVRAKGKNRSLPGRKIELTDLPSGWAWVTFDDCAWDLTVGHVGPMKDRYVQEGLPFLRSLNVRPNYIDLNNIVFIDKHFHGELSKSRLVPGDLVVVRTGEPGVAAVIPDSLPEANCSDLVIGRLIHSLCPHFAAFYMNSEFAKQVVRGFQVGVAQQHFNVGAMSETPIPFPPHNEQREIIRRIETAFGWLDRLAAEHVKATRLLPRLDQEILAKAFHGELVPQDPTDEPASVLLERIRAERVNAPKQKRQPKPRGESSIRAPREKAAMTKSRYDEDVKGKPYLAGLLRQLEGETTSADELFRRSELSVADFYKQLAWEVDAGHIRDNDERLEAA